MPDPQAHHAQPEGRLEIANDRDAIMTLGDRVIRAAEEAGYSEASRFAVRLALEEAIVNAFKHGHKSLPEDETVHVEFEIEPDEIRIRVTDKGPGFSPEDVPDPTTEENLSKTSGRGLLLMRAYMTDVTHNDSGNQIRMTYARPESQS